MIKNIMEIIEIMKITNFIIIIIIVAVITTMFRMKIITGSGHNAKKIMKVMILITIKKTMIRI